MLLVNFGKECAHLHKFVSIQKFTLKTGITRVQNQLLQNFIYQNARCCSNTSNGDKEKKEGASANPDSNLIDPDKSRYIRDVLYDQFQIPKKVDYNKAYLAMSYNKNTFIDESRAKSEYLLTREDLEDVRTTKVRTAYSHDISPQATYLKLDVEKKAVDKWGSTQAIEQEKRKRKEIMETMEARQQVWNQKIGDLKKDTKDERRVELDKSLFGTKDQRDEMLKGSGKVVLYAIVSNLFITVIKLLAAKYTGSASMLAEAIHSAADTLNQGFLYYGIYKSLRQPSPDHPYGWEKSRYIYALISGCGIFFLGCGVSIYHGISQLITPALTLEAIDVAYYVLGISFVIEGAVMIKAYQQVKKSAFECDLSLREYINRGRDPNAVAVLLEDATALIGVVIASIMLGLTQWTKLCFFDSVGSIFIGGLLGSVAIFLIQKNADSLVGRSIPPDRRQKLMEILEDDIMVKSIHDVKATEMGADTVRFKAEVFFDGRELTNAHLNSIDTELLLKKIQEFETKEELELWLRDYGVELLDLLGKQVDRIEEKIKKTSPEVRHVDLEIL